MSKTEYKFPPDTEFNPELIHVNKRHLTEKLLSEISVSEFI